MVQNISTNTIAHPKIALCAHRYHFTHTNGTVRTQIALYAHKHHCKQIAQTA